MIKFNLLDAIREGIVNTLRRPSLWIALAIVGFVVFVVARNM